MHVDTSLTVNFTVFVLPYLPLTPSHLKLLHHLINIQIILQNAFYDTGIHVFMWVQFFLNTDNMPALDIDQQNTDTLYGGTHESYSVF